MTQWFKPFEIRYLEKTAQLWNVRSTSQSVCVRGCARIYYAAMAAFAFLVETLQAILYLALNAGIWVLNKGHALCNKPPAPPPSAPPPPPQPQQSVAAPPPSPPTTATVAPPPPPPPPAPQTQQAVVVQPPPVTVATVVTPPPPPPEPGLFARAGQDLDRRLTQGAAVATSAGSTAASLAARTKNRAVAAARHATGKAGEALDWCAVPPPPTSEPSFAHTWARVGGVVERLGWRPAKTATLWTWNTARNAFASGTGKVQSGYGSLKQWATDITANAE